MTRAQGTHKKVLNLVRQPQAARCLLKLSPDLNTVQGTVRFQPTNRVSD